MTMRLELGFLAIFAIWLIAAPVETFARGGGFTSGHAVSSPRAFRAPIVRPGVVRPGVARPPAAVRARTHGVPSAHFRHRLAPPVAVWVGEPWYRATIIRPTSVPMSNHHPIARPPNPTCRFL